MNQHTEQNMAIGKPYTYTYTNPKFKFEKSQ